MLLVDTIIKPSPIHGLGCFTSEFVRKDTVIWIFDKRFDIVIDPEDYKSLPYIHKNFIKIYGYLDTHQYIGKYILHAGNDRFINHSNTPTIIYNNDDNVVGIAAHDLQIGTELTDNYLEYDEFSKQNFPTN